MGKNLISNSEEIKRNRGMIIGLTILSVIMFLLLMAMWHGITPGDLTIALSFDKEIKFINASTVYVEPEIMNIINSRYSSDRSEFIYCLHGRVGDDSYIIEKIVETKVISSDDDYVRYESCKRTKDYLGTIHSHPKPSNPAYYASCKLSKQDIFSFGAEDMPLTAVICGKDKVAFYGKDDFDNPYEYEVLKEHE